MTKPKSVFVGLVLVVLVAVAGYASVKWREAQSLDEGIVAAKNGEYDKAIRLLEPLSDAGNPVARDTLGMMYAYGWGVQRNRDRAAKLIASAGVSNAGEAFYSIGKELEEGKIVSKDKTEATEWFKLAAQAGHAQAKARIAKPGG